MNNFPITNTDGKTYWVSRSVAVVAIVIAFEEGHTYVLATQRGSGTPDPEYVGSWCLPCGYVDYDETTAEAAAREVHEETGLTLDARRFKLVSINDNPLDDKRQNITFRYKAYIRSSKSSIEQYLSTEFSEKNEVSDVKFIDVNEVSNYKWAFNHIKLINEYIPSRNKEIQ
jgi:8-oxo-dGTP diphosphatase